MPSITQSRHKPSRSAHRLIAAVALTGVALVSACGSSSKSSAKSTGATAAAANSATVVLKFSDPGNSGIFAYAKKTGALDAALSKVNAKVSWGGTYPSFTTAISALHEGALNVQQGAVSPALGYLAHASDIKIFATSNANPDPGTPTSSAILVPKGSSIHSLKDLEGKTVAVNQAGHGEYLLLLALQQAGIPVNSVHRVYLTPTAAASAFATGKVDALVAFLPILYGPAVAAGARTIVDADTLPSKDLGIFVAKSDLVKEHPEVIRALFNEIVALTKQSKEHPEDFQNVFLKEGPTATSGARLASDIATTRGTALPRYPTKADEQSAQSVADLFKKYGVLPTDFSLANAFVNLGP